jgi:hypothetical protein
MARRKSSTSDENARTPARVLRAPELANWSRPRLGAITSAESAFHNSSSIRSNTCRPISWADGKGLHQQDLVGGLPDVI